MVKVWFQNTRARDRREGQHRASPMAFKHLLPPTPPASCSTGSQKHSSPATSPAHQPEVNLEVNDEVKEENDKIPLDLSTKPSTPSASPPPLVINSEAEDDSEDETETETDPVSGFSGFSMTSRPPIDIDQLAKQHFDNMIRAKLVTLEPTAEAMLPDAPVVTTSTASKKKPTAVSPKLEATTSSNNPTIYSCDQCDKTFTKKSSITRHKYEHSGMKIVKIKGVFLYYRHSNPIQDSYENMPF